MTSFKTDIVQCPASVESQRIVVKVNPWFLEELTLYLCS